LPATAIWPREAGTARSSVRLREATPADAARLAELYAASGAPHQDAAEIRAWLARGGTLLVERVDGPVLAAVRWLPTEAGWRVERVTTRPEERGNGFGRWLMTKLEALAIRGNVPLLDLELDEEALLPYYRRLGYRQEGASPLRLTKRVGGVWQRQVAP
jgi:GNAT superfamily N-acetyltransferase